MVLKLAVALLGPNLMVECFKSFKNALKRLFKFQFCFCSKFSGLTENSSLCPHFNVKGNFKDEMLPEGL